MIRQLADGCWEFSNAAGILGFRKRHDAAEKALLRAPRVPSRPRVRAESKNPSILDGPIVPAHELTAKGESWSLKKGTKVKTQHTEAAAFVTVSGKIVAAVGAETIPAATLGEAQITAAAMLRVAEAKRLAGSRRPPR
jgi:hypothetical protein